MANDRKESWRRSFPTYEFGENEMVLKEYEFASKSLEVEERLFLNATNITVLLVAGALPFALTNSEKALSSLSPTLAIEEALIIGLIVQFSFAVLLLRYFADRQKTIVFASRKVITLRRMLGVRYGSTRLVLPNWRIEGADEPLAIRMFPGWNTSVAFPCFMIAGGVALCSFVVLVKLAGALPISLERYSLGIAACSAVFLFFALCLIYRKALFDTHESTCLLLAKVLAAATKCGIENNF